MSASTRPLSARTKSETATVDADAADDAPSNSNNHTTTVLSNAAVEALLQDPTLGTAEMRASLKGLQRALTCPLCRNLFCDPVTVQCAHSFCRRCIDHHSQNSWNCPVPECGAPLIPTSGSFRKVYPPLHSAMESFTTICETLQQAHPYWWKDCKTADEAAPPATRTTTSTTTTNNNNNEPIINEEEEVFATADESTQQSQQPANEQEEDEVIDLMAGVESSPRSNRSSSSSSDDNSFQGDDDDEVFCSAREE